MNYLAHAYLSFNDPGILIGNMISDHVKGKTRFEYPHDIQNGIRLHRLIDAFTDAHEATREAKQIFRPVYRLYSGAFVDIVYDHFLATDPEEFDERSLALFSSGVYQRLDQGKQWLPEAFGRMFPYMKEHDWLYNYSHRWGIERSFAGMVRRAAFIDNSSTAFELFETNYQLLSDCYRHFWAFVKPFAKQEFDQMQNNTV
jgi:acyl carrier protein phosphodiesterase